MSYYEFDFVVGQVSTRGRSEVLTKKFVITVTELLYKLLFLSPVNDPFAVQYIVRIWLE